MNISNDYFHGPSIGGNAPPPLPQIFKGGNISNFLPPPPPNDFGVV